MVDTHAHIFVEEFQSDFDEVLSNAFSNGVKKIIIPSIEPKTFKKVLEVSSLDNRLYCSMGVHPHNAAELNDDVLMTIEEHCRNTKVIAIGEIGLDYYYDFNPPEIQKKAFIEQVRLAKKLNLPIIVHNRESDGDLLTILEKEQDGDLRGVLHCFSGDIEMMKKSVELGFHVSFTGNITFKKAEVLREVVRETPLDRILLETDSPWMAPVPLRGTRNEPKNLNLIAAKIAEIKSISINEVTKMTTKSANQLFKLSLIILLLLFNSIVFAQDLQEEIDNINPYPKLVGLGFTIGTNTVVNTYKPEGNDVSDEGLFAYGGSMTGYPLDFIFLQVSYLQWKNDKPFKNTKKFDTTKVFLDPENSSQFEFAIGVIPNPHSKVNFFLLTGYSFSKRNYTQIDWVTDPMGLKLYLSDSKDAIIGGLGFIANIPVSGAGVFTLSAEWRLNFLLNSTILDVDPRKELTTPEYRKKTEYTTFYSIPRVTISWFPPFGEWF